MNDGVMYTWEVVRDDIVLHTCARKSTAEYLKDWVEAIDENGARDYIDLIGKNYVIPPFWVMKDGTPDYKVLLSMYKPVYVTEGEVIL